MIYTQEQLVNVEKMASLYMKISDIAFIIGVSPEELRSDIANNFSDVSKAYNRGKASSKVALRAQEMQLAKVGSPLALENCRRNLLDMEDDE